MTKLWILLAVSLVFARLIDGRDQHFRAIGSRQHDRILTLILAMILVFFCGLRIWGNDTHEYLEVYTHLVPPLEELTPEHTPSFSSGFLFFYVGSALKSLNFSNQDFLMFFAFLTVIPYFMFVRRYSKSLVFGVFLMFATGFYTFSLAAIKQCSATALCLIAVSCYLSKKYLLYFLLVGVACLFHPYAIVYLLVPLLDFKPWSGKTLTYVIIFAAAGFFLERLLGTVLDITDMMGASYDETSFTGEGVNLFRVIVCLVPMIIALFYGKTMFDHTSRAENLMFNMAMLNGLIMFVGMFGTANYFARLANYFLPAQVIVLPKLLSRTHPKDRKWLIPLCIVGYLGYFYYENAIIRPFDSSYAHASFWDYIRTLY